MATLSREEMQKIRRERDPFVTNKEKLGDLNSPTGSIDTPAEAEEESKKKKNSDNNTPRP